jgi:hypothetical protein
LLPIAPISAKHAALMGIAAAQFAPYQIANEKAFLTVLPYVFTL